MRVVVLALGREFAARRVNKERVEVEAGSCAKIEVAQLRLSEQAAIAAKKNKSFGEARLQDAASHEHYMHLHDIHQSRSINLSRSSACAVAPSCSPSPITPTIVHHGDRSGCGRA